MLLATLVTVSTCLLDFSASYVRRHRGSTLFPYTTLFRSWLNPIHGGVRGGRGAILSSQREGGDRKSTRLNSSHPSISYAVFCLKKKRRHGFALEVLTWPQYAVKQGKADVSTGDALAVNHR